MNNVSAITHTIESIRKELMAVFRERCLKPDMGFQDEGSSGKWDIPWTDIITRIDVYYKTSDGEICDIANAYYAVFEVGVELDFDGMCKISEVGDKVIYRYDQDAYFDFESPGIMTAYLIVSHLTSVSSSTSIKAADDLPKEIPAESLAEMSKNEIFEFLENLPAGTALTGIVNAPGTFGRNKWGDGDVVVRKECGYTGPYYNHYGMSPADTKYMDSWWMISGYKSHSWDLVSIIRGRNKYYDVLALEDDSVESSTNINAAWFNDPEPSLEDDRPEPDYYDDEEAEIELDIDAVIIMDKNGSWEYDDTTYPWAKNPQTKNGDWYADLGIMGDVYIDDPSGIVEKVDELLEALLPLKAGTFHITGYADLFFNISNISGNTTAYGLDEDGDLIADTEYYTDDADVEFNFQKSSIKNFEINEIK